MKTYKECVDQFGLPLNIGDKVMVAKHSAENYTSRISCNYFEGVVTKIDIHCLAIGKDNKEITISRNELSNQTIYELTEQAAGRESMKYANNASDAQGQLLTHLSIKEKYYSNDVIKIDIVKQVIENIVDGAYPEFLI